MPLYVAFRMHGLNVNDLFPVVYEIKRGIYDQSHSRNDSEALF